MSEYTQRTILERDEKWAEIINLMPKLKFKNEWDVTIIPPFNGVVARFLVYYGKGSVSVYCDWYEKLGFFGGPHWEIYPDTDEENWRCALNETTKLMAAIEASLNKQNEVTP